MRNLILIVIAALTITSCKKEDAHEICNPDDHVRYNLRFMDVRAQSIGYYNPFKTDYGELKVGQRIVFKTGQEAVILGINDGCEETYYEVECPPVVSYGQSADQEDYTYHFEDGTVINWNYVTGFENKCQFDELISILEQLTNLDNTIRNTHYLDKEYNPDFCDHPLIVGYLDNEGNIVKYDFKLCD